MYILMFILGAFCGMFGIGIVMASSTREEVAEAYKKGRADERGYILEQIEKNFGVKEPPKDVLDCTDPSPELGMYGGNDNG